MRAHCPPARDSRAFGSRGGVVTRLRSLVDGRYGVRRRRQARGWMATVPDLADQGERWNRKKPKDGSERNARTSAVSALQRDGRRHGVEAH